MKIYFCFPAVSEQFNLVAHVTTRKTTTCTTTPRELPNEEGSNWVDDRRQRDQAQGGENEEERPDEGVFRMHQARVRLLVSHQQKRRRTLPRLTVVVAHMRRRYQPEGQAVLGR